MSHEVELSLLLSSLKVGRLSGNSKPQSSNPMVSRFSVAGPILFFFFGLFAISWAAPAAYGGSQARGLIGAVATSLRQSHSNAGSEPRL